MAYLFSHEEKKERERLAAIEAMGNPFTIECLEKIGVGEGWRCLEIGAGGGSIALNVLNIRSLAAVVAPNLGDHPENRALGVSKLFPLARLEERIIDWELHPHRLFYRVLAANPEDVDLSVLVFVE